MAFLLHLHKTNQIYDNILKQIFSVLVHNKGLIMDKKLTVMEAAKLLGVSKEAIYNRLRRGTLQCVVEEGVKYILLGKNTHKEPHASARKVRSGPLKEHMLSFLKEQLEALKVKNERLEADKERLIADKERLLIESKEKIEAIYKERDEQLKSYFISG